MPSQLLASSRNDAGTSALVEPDRRKRASAAAGLALGAAVLTLAASQPAAAFSTLDESRTAQTPHQMPGAHPGWVALVPATIIHWAGAPDTVEHRGRMEGLLPGSTETPDAVLNHGPLTKTEVDAVRSAGYELPDGVRVVPVPRYRISAWYKQPGPHANGVHGGLDFAAPVGTPIYAASAGTVTRAEWQGGAGQAVTIRSEDGLVVMYDHMSTMIARKGERVLAGDLIGKVGATGHTTGPHLHLQVNNVGGRSHDPRTWLGAGKKQLIALGRPGPR